MKKTGGQLSVSFYSSNSYSIVYNDSDIHPIILF